MSNHNHKHIEQPLVKDFYVSELKTTVSLTALENKRTSAIGLLYGRSLGENRLNSHGQ